MIFSGADFSAKIRLRLQFHFLRIRKQKGFNRLIVDLSLDPNPRGPAPCALWEFLRFHRCLPILTAEIAALTAGPTAGVRGGGITREVATRPITCR